MNANYHNIEYRPFPGHSYRVGYDNGGNVWHVKPMKRGYIVCNPRTGEHFGSPTLQNVSARLMQQV